MSALPSTTDIHQGGGYVSFVPKAEVASLLIASSPLFINRGPAPSSFRFAHRLNWAFVPNQLQFVAAARALKIAKLIARHYWFGDAAQHFDVALRTGWPVVDVRAHRHHCLRWIPARLSFRRFVFRQMPLWVSSSVICLQQNCHIDMNAVPTGGTASRIEQS